MAMPLPAWICDLGRVEYVATAELQRALRSAREGAAIPDTVLVLEHDPVITTGHRTEAHDVAYALTTDVPVVPTERGGKATYHGPGQVVAYPIFDLAAHGSDIKQYVRTLEQALIDTLAAVEIDAARREGYPGVWTGHDVADRPKKIASIGVRVTKWVSFHGIALNVDCDLAPFGWFTPCGIPDVTMTNIALERSARGLPPVSVEHVRQLLVGELVRHFGLQTTHVERAELDAVAAMAQVPA